VEVGRSTRRDVEIPANAHPVEQLSLNLFDLPDGTSFASLHKREIGSLPTFEGVYSS
jgi:hypothetical protein